MNELERWTAAAGEVLGLPEAGLAEHRELVLDVAREVAHGVLRPAAPLSAYLLGLAVGRGAEPRRAAADLTDLARSWSDAPQS